jgi:hypothetical protein
MAIAGVGKRYAGDPVHIAADIHLWRDPLHDIARTEQALPGRLASRDQFPDPFVMNGVRSARCDKVMHAELHEQVPHMEGI